MTILNKTSALNRKALEAFDNLYTVSKLHPETAYLFDKLPKESMSARLYKHLSTTRLLTLDMIRTLSLKDFSNIDGFGKGMEQELEKLVKNRNGWFFPDHEDSGLIGRRIFRQKILYGNAAIGSYEAEKDANNDLMNDMAQKKKFLEDIIVQKMFDSRMAAFFGINAYNRTNHTRLKNTILANDIENLSLADLAKFKKAELPKLGFSRAMSTLLVTMVHKVGGNFRDDQPDKVASVDQAGKIYKKYHHIIGTNAQCYKKPSLTNHTRERLIEWTINIVDLLKMPVNEVLPKLPKEIVSKLADNQKDLLGEVLLDGVDDVGLSKKETKTLLKAMTSLGVSPGLQEKARQEYYELFPPEKKPIHHRHNRINNLFDLYPNK